MYLRGQYTREVAKKKERKSGSGTEEVYKPTAYWFKELGFLEEFIKVRKGGSNFNVSINLLLSIKKYSYFN